MALQDQLQQLQSQLPDFWTKRLDEATFVQTLMLAYSYVYGSANQKTQTMMNLSSPYTVDAYVTDYYKVIDIRQAVTPTDPTLQSSGNLYFVLPLGTFNIDTLSRDLTFSSSLSYQLYYDATLKQTLLEVAASQFTSTDRYFYIREYDVDNDNVVGTWGSLFPGIKPFGYIEYAAKSISELLAPNGSFANNKWGVLLTNLFLPYSISSENIYGRYINSSAYEQYILNIKAQVINMIKCANGSGTIDALESLISVAMNQPFVTSDGIIVDFNDSTIWIETEGAIIEFNGQPKPKFRQQNQHIFAYEAPCVCPVNFYSWATNPARFTQALLEDTCWRLFNLLALEPNESPVCLRFDQEGLSFDKSGNPYSFDFGLLAANKNLSCSPNYPSLPYDIVNDFTAWTNETLDPTVYEFFRNVIVCEYDPSVIDREWLSSILEYFRPLHCKYLMFEVSYTGG